MNKYCSLLLLLFALVIMSNVFLAEEEIASENLRCEMFQIWTDSRGEYGWPPKSNPDAAERCKAGDK